MFYLLKKYYICNVKQSTTTKHKAMERPEKKVQIKRIAAPDGISCNGCKFMWRGECIFPTSAEVQFDVEIGENDTLPPFRCYDYVKKQRFIFVDKY